jgi:hypothetical protein
MDPGSARLRRLSGMNSDENDMAPLRARSMDGADGQNRIIQFWLAARAR